MSDTPKDAKSIFLAALDIQNPGERATFVAQCCQGDDPLRKRVEDLLRAYGESGGPLDKLAVALAPTRLGESIREQVGSTIGPYKLMEQIGEGGFGLVFVAEQQAPIRRKVALKIIKPGMDTRDVIARFEAERQALALMDHPNIAGVLDAGTTESGRPYFVMELVRGIPITDYCDQTQLTPRERLELFVPVCNAIQHAHLKGIIHRDVKPSNVLVTMHDARPVVKVIDFGVAKALHQQLTDRTIYTRYAQMIGTPLYMSPEQAQMSGLDIDTRSDIYSLGVLLYELLTGSTPFNKERLAKAAYDELLKIIREEEPPKPSARLSQSTDTLPSIAAQRKTEPAKLSKMFRGDLDWIAMKALEKDRTRRYETANAFAADVLRYLNDEPVEASPPSAGYRLRKFARKHRRPVIALAAIVTVLLMGIAGTTWGLFRAQQAEQAANTSEQKTIEALGQVTNERDAKTTALNTASAERDRAERQLAIGLLRPIGFSPSSPDLAELRGLVDWSAIKESRLKLRVLEVAFENPETALRVARQAERVVQACVGLSPTRYAQAMKLVLNRQGDLSADPRIRVGACWLALELGSAELPAWKESCKYLSDVRDQQSAPFAEFVSFAVSRSDPRQIAQLDSEPLIEILETSNEPNVRVYAANGIGTLAPQMAPAQARHAWDVTMAIWAKSHTTPDPKRSGVWIGFQPNTALAALAPRLDPEDVKREADALIATLRQRSDFHTIEAPLGGLVALAPRLQSAQSKLAWDALIALPKKSRNLTMLSGVGAGLQALVARLPLAEVPSAVDTLIAMPEKSAQPAAKGLAALAPRMEPAQARLAWNALIAVAEKSTNDNLPQAVEHALPTLAPRIEVAEVPSAADALIAKLKNSARPSLLSVAGAGVRALAPRLSAGQVRRAADILIAIADKSPKSAAQVLTALAPRMEPALASVAWDALIKTSEKLSSDDPTDEMQQVFTALVPRLAPMEVARAADPLIAQLEKSTPRQVPKNVGAGLLALSPRLSSAELERIADHFIGPLEKSINVDTRYIDISHLLLVAGRLRPAKARRAADLLIAIMEKPPNEDDFCAATVGIGTLLPQLEPAQITRAAVALMRAQEKPMDGGTLYSVNLGTLAIAPWLEPTLQNDLSTRAAAVLLDSYCSLEVPQNPWLRINFGTDPQQISWGLEARSILFPRSLAELLSHPACIAQQREFLLQRFEELVFYDGKPVYRKPEPRHDDRILDPFERMILRLDAPEEIQLSQNHPPPRRFQSLQDAAAWIQKNWPDFDLETSHPVSWHALR